ncbi:hypothetical protein [Sphingobacterium multivorum]|uniref:hypothetical protein n=1 Tax=Sphingobacterium multivorum TaxID=28454 RepID=UPI0028AE2E03|nr:hypothetical protein [Sphingobacterium multivorum]
MNKNEKKNALESALSGLKKLVFGAESEAKTIKTQIKYKFEIVQDTEGKTLQYPALEVGAPVTIGDGEGGEVASDGNYQIDESTSIVVKDGVIESIDQPEVAEESAEEMNDEDANASADNSDVAQKVIEVADAVQAQVDAINEEVKALTDAVASFAKMDENVKALTDAVAKFSKEPVAVSVTKENNQSAKDSKINQLAGIFGKK